MKLLYNMFGRYADDEEIVKYYKDQVIHLLFIAYFTKFQFNYKKKRKMYQTWLEKMIFKPKHFVPIYEHWKLIHKDSLKFEPADINNYY